jgi:hypothetical protein
MLSMCRPMTGFGPRQSRSKSVRLSRADHEAASGRDPVRPACRLCHGQGVAADQPVPAQLPAIARSADGRALRAQPVRSSAGSVAAGTGLPSSSRSISPVEKPVSSTSKSRSISACSTRLSSARRSAWCRRRRVPERSQKMLSLWGTEGSNPSSSSGESRANLTCSNTGNEDVHRQGTGGVHSNQQPKWCRAAI